MGNNPDARDRAVERRASWIAIGIVALIGCAQAGWAIARSGWDADPPPAARSAVMPMGTNLDGLYYWSPGLPVIDLMKSAGNWLPQRDGEYDTGERVALDADGWVARLPGPGDPAHYTSVLVNVLHDNPAAPPHARYVVLYDGQGTLSLVGLGGSAVVSEAPGRMVVTAGDAGGLYLRLTATDPRHAGNPIRNIRIVREDLLPLYEAGLTFDPAFLAKIDAFQVLRFMDWMNTNLLLDTTGRPVAEADIARAPLLGWKDRARPADRSWGDASRGVPVEALVEIANRTGAEPWFNMPVNASDDYVRGFATFVRDHLRPDLRIHVEFSNEVWNWLFPQARYAQARARARFGADANWMRWYGWRAAQVGAIWKAVFGEAPRARNGRIAMVYNTQFAWKGLEADGLDAPAADGSTPASAWFDEYAITGYYDGTMNTDAVAPTVRGWWRDPDGGYGRAVAALKARIADTNAPLYRYHADQAHKRGLRLVSYESGFGEYTPPSQHGDQAYTDFLHRLQRRPELYALEMQNYRAFQAAGGTLFMNFGIINTPTKWGSWAALESIRQASSPRYRALSDWIAANPAWRAGQGSARAIADAKIYRAGAKGETIEGTAHGYDVLIGGAGDDRFVPRGGPETRIEGGGGHDVLVLSAPRSAYRFAAAPGGATRVSGPDGSQIVTHVAAVSFAAGRSVALASIVGRRA